MTTIQTTTGPIDGDTVALALPHEHLFVDLLGPTHPDYCGADWTEVRGVCNARLTALGELGIDLLLDCTPIGIGRNVDLLRDVADTTGVRIACATGIYKGFVPPRLAEASPEELAGVFVRELTDGIDGSDICAGFIKLATTETGPTPRETEIHRAGAIAAAETGAAIVLHSPQARVTRAVLATLEAEGFDPARLVWAHAHDSTLEENFEIAARGVTISFDGVSAYDDGETMDRIAALTDAGFGDRVVVSTDTSIWINPPEMAYERSIDHLLGSFLPAVETRLGPEVRDRLVSENVAKAVGLQRSPGKSGEDVGTSEEA
jgi:phosphotriesterase-related protein